MDHVVIAVFVFISALATALVGWYGSMKYKIGPSQELLVKTLQGVVAAQAERIKQLELEVAALEAERKSLGEEIARLTERVERLEEIIVHQAEALDKVGIKINSLEIK